MAETQTARITRTPGVCGGKAGIAGHRIRVLDIVHWYEGQGKTPDEIVDMFPTITLSDVHSVLAYYYDHPQEIRDEVRREREIHEEFRRQPESVVQRKLNKAVAKRRCG